MNSENRTSLPLSSRSRAAVSAGMLLLAPIAALMGAYGGAAVMIAISGWVLSDERSIAGTFGSNKPREVLAKLLLSIGGVSFVSLFVVLFARLW